MKRISLILIFTLLFLSIGTRSDAQCAMCTKTAQQLGEKPAKSLNTGIIYLMVAPFGIVGFIAFRWWKNNKDASV
jgi:hypothetical protein